MSKGTIGTFLGAGIGFLIGGPAGAQIGALIGGAVGSSFDTIPGRKVGEMGSPRAQEGEPIPLVFGSARVTGRLMSVGEPDIRTESEGGKGGPKVENETAYLSYSILVCESSELRDSSIAGILMVIENNKIVYDVRPVPAISGADSAKWKANKVFYFGGEGQGVDPTEQMIHGAGNVPAYRGLCRMVVTDEDVTQHGGGIPTYEFVTSQCGVASDELLSERFMSFGVAGGGFRAVSRPLDADVVWVGASDADVFQIDETTAYGFAVYGGKAFATDNGGLCSVADLTALDTWTAGPTGSAVTANASGLVVAGDRLWQAAGTSGVNYLDAPTDASFQTVATFGGENIVEIAPVSGGVVAVSASAKLYAAPIGTAFTQVNDRYLPAGMSIAPDMLASNGDRMILVGFRYAPVVEYSDDMGATCIEATFPATGNPSPVCARFAGGTRWLVGCTAASATTGLFMSTDDALTFAPVTLPHVINIGKAGIAIDGISGRCVVYGTEVGTSTRRAYWTDDYSAWNEFTFTGTDANSRVYPIYRAGEDGAYVPPEGAEEIPDAPGHYVDPDTGEVTGPTSVIEGTCPPITLQEIIDKLDARAGIPVANSVTTELADIEVPGYAIDQFVTVAEAKEPLRQVWFFDCPEWDDAIRYRLRGQATDFTIDPDDLIEGEDATEQGTRGQTVEYPKRLHVQYVDPVTGYKPMKQTAERISPDIRVKGELVAGANITLSADTAKQAADIGLKTAWTEREDSREFAIPIDYWPQAIAAHTFTLDSRRYRITELRLEAGAIYIKSVYDRISAYSSNAIGTVGPSPTGQSNLRGPTVSAVMNLPVLRDADDKAGIYWAASGLLDTWQGAQLQLQRGGVYENGPQITSSATMGELTASLPTASRYGMDTVNTLSVRLTMTSGSLDSVTYDDLIAEANAAAIVYADGTAEIVQFQTATEIAPREYELTGLLRGRLDTTPGTHAIGAQFVLLNDAVRFVGIRPDDLGQTLTFRAVSLGTSADSNATQAITMTTIESLREWQPYNFEVTVTDDGGYCAEWIGRARLGSSRLPVHSQWFEGYRVTFTAGDESHEVITTEQSVCVTAEDLADLEGAVPEVTVAAKSRVASGDDDFSSAPTTGAQTIVAPGSAGSLPDGYVGVPYSNIGAFGDPWVDVGNRFYRRVSGDFWPGASVSHKTKTFADTDWQFDICGVPMVAGTYTAVPRVDTGDGSYTDSQSVTIAAKPSFAVLDFSGRTAAGVTHTGASPAFTGVRLSGGAILDCAGWTAGKVYCEITVSSLTVLYAGVHGAALTSKYVGGADTLAKEITATGTYALAFDTATGDLWVRNAVGWIGGGDPAAGTSPTLSGLTATVNGRFRFGFTGAATLQANFGNVAWAYTIPAGFAGVAMPSVDVPAIWDVQSLQDNTRFVLQSLDGRPASLLRAIVSNAPEHRGNVTATIGKAAGQWQVGLINNRGIDGFYVGLVESAYVPGINDVPGAAGTDDSIGIRGVVAVPVAPYDQPHILIQTSFGGVHTEYIHPREFTQVDEFTVAADLTAGTVAIYADGVLLRTISGVPAGTWYPAASILSNGTAGINGNPEYPIGGFTDWTTTV